MSEKFERSYQAAQFREPDKTLPPMEDGGVFWDETLAWELDLSGVDYGKDDLPSLGSQLFLNDKALVNRSFSKQLTQYDWEVYDYQGVKISFDAFPKLEAAVLAALRRKG